MKSFFKKKKGGFLGIIFEQKWWSHYYQTYIGKNFILFTNQMSLMIGLLCGLPCQQNTIMNRGVSDHTATTKHHFCAFILVLPMLASQHVGNNT